MMNLPENKMKEETAQHPLTEVKPVVDYVESKQVLEMKVQLQEVHQKLEDKNDK